MRTYAKGLVGQMRTPADRGVWKGVIFADFLYGQPLWSSLALHDIQQFLMLDSSANIQIVFNTAVACLDPRHCSRCSFSVQCAVSWVHSFHSVQLYIHNGLQLTLIRCINTGSENLQQFSYKELKKFVELDPRDSLHQANLDNTNSRTNIGRVLWKEAGVPWYCISPPISLFGGDE